MNTKEELLEERAKIDDEIEVIELLEINSKIADMASKLHIRKSELMRTALSLLEGHFTKTR